MTEQDLEKLQKRRCRAYKALQRTALALTRIRRLAVYTEKIWREKREYYELLDREIHLYTIGVKKLDDLEPKTNKEILSNALRAISKLSDEQIAALTKAAKESK